MIVMILGDEMMVQLVEPISRIIVDVSVDEPALHIYTN